MARHSSEVKVYGEALKRGQSIWRGTQAKSKYMVRHSSQVKVYGEALKRGQSIW